MKKIYDCEQFIAFAPHYNFQETSIKWHLHLLNATQALDSTNRTYYQTFEDFYTAVEEGKVRNANAYIGWLFRQPKVKVICGFDTYVITKRNFKEICVWNHAKAEPNLSINVLMKNLPADEFVEYLCERGISFPSP